MKKSIFVLLLLSLVGSAQSQDISPADLKILQKKEDSLKDLMATINLDSFTAGRMIADSQFTRTLVRSLQVRNSFYFPFDSVRGMGNVYAPDSLFRIITWQLPYDDYYCRQRGAIQFKTRDGSLRLMPLLDVSEFTEYPNDSARKRNQWIGAVYYDIVKKEHKGKSYYTLFGFDANSVNSSKKWIEVLHFENNEPVFGGPFFTFEKDSIKKAPLHRFSIEYKKEASAMINYDPELDIILVDHLVSESDDPDLPHTYVPDGDYEGFKWVNGRWQHIEKVFDQKLEDGEFPVPDPILDERGNVDQEKLKQRSQKNKAGRDQK